LPGILFGGSDFGQVTGTLNSPRRMQFGLRFQF